MEAGLFSKDRTRVVVAVIVWFPVAIGSIYVAAFIEKFSDLITRVYWDSDAAVAPLLAQSAGHGTVSFERYAYFASFLYLVVTRWLPFHRELWYVTPYLVSLASAGVLAAVSWRIGGRWAAAMTTTLAVATAPLVNYDRVT